MDLLIHLRRQFAYDAWANQQVVAAMKASSSAPTRLLQLLAHIISAERLWLERLMRQPQSSAVWPDFDLDQCQTQIADLGGLWHKYLGRLSSAGLAENVSYKNSKGELWNSTVADVLTHVVLHSAYHRGQIASLMREGGQTPASTDFIHATRQGLIE